VFGSVGSRVTASEAVNDGCEFRIVSVSGVG
jgi:hypothetical protein